MLVGDVMTFTALIEEYRQAGFSTDDAREEAAREVRMTTGDIYFGRSPKELAEMKRQELEMYAYAASCAGVSEEFPAGEFAAAAQEYFGHDDEGDWDA